MSGHRSLAILLAILASCVASANADDPVTVPLKNIWAYQMPGTRDVRELEPQNFGQAVRKLTSDEQLKRYGQSLTSRILKTLQVRPTNQKAKKAFAVLGTGVDALREAHAVLAERQRPRRTLPVDAEVSVVFFSYSFGSYVHLNKVEREGNTVTVSCRFVPHETKEMTAHFALIPIGKFKLGEVKVTVVSSPMEKRFVDSGFKPVSAETESQVVSRSFRLLVEEEKQ